MMNITLRTGVVVSWHVNTPIHVLRDRLEHQGYGEDDYGNKLPGSVVEVYADGHELEHILAAFRNLPYKEGSRSMTYKGDLACLIVDNL